LIRLAKNSLVLLLIFFLCSCIGPIKEIKYQIEDSLEDESIPENPSPLEEIQNSYLVNILNSGSFGDPSFRNLFITNIDDLIFYPSTHSVTCFSLDNNTVQWKYKHHTDITSGISSSNEKVFFVDYEGFLVAINLKGSIEWKVFVGEILSPPVFADGSVIVRSTNGIFSSLNIIDGSVKWTYKVPSSPLPIRSWGELTVSENILYAGIGSGKVISINIADGSLIWETTYSSPKGVSEIERSNDTTSKVIVDEFALYAISSKGNIAAISKSNGDILWSRALSSFDGMVTNNDSLFVTHSTGSLYKIDKNNFKVIWRNSDLQGRNVTRPFLYKNFVVVSDFDGYLHFLSLNDGKIMTRIKISDTHLLKPLLTNESNNLFYVSSSGDYYLVNINLDSKVEKDEHNGENNEVYAEKRVPINENESESDSILDSLKFWE
jgi:outer membrane protein assembly factor BamB